MAATTKIRTNVPMISPVRFEPNRGMAGEVEKHASFKSASSVTSQCGRKCSQTRVAPAIAPSICARMKEPTLEKSPLVMANPSVTAGFRCAAELPQAIAVKMPVITANAQPVVIAIQPAPSALVRLSSTLATTPLPIRIRISVPMNSPKNFDAIEFLSRLVQPIERPRHGLLPKPVQFLPAGRLHLRLPGLIHGPAPAQVV